MNTYAICKLLILNNRYTYEDMFDKLDLFLMLSRISYEEYVELTGMLIPPTVEDSEEVVEELTEEI